MVWCPSTEEGNSKTLTATDPERVFPQPLSTWEPSNNCLINTVCLERLGANDIPCTSTLERNLVCVCSCAMVRVHNCSDGPFGQLLKWYVCGLAQAPGLCKYAHWKQTAIQYNLQYFVVFRKLVEKNFENISNKNTCSARQIQSFFLVLSPFS